MKIRRSLLKDTVVVRTRQGETSYGDSLADPVTIPCDVDETRRLVRDVNGQETVSEALLTLHPRSYATPASGPRTVVDPMNVFTAESEVQINGRLCRVITSKTLKIRGYVMAVEVTCT